MNTPSTKALELNQSTIKADENPSMKDGYLLAIQNYEEPLAPLQSSPFSFAQLMQYITHGQHIEQICDWLRDESILNRLPNNGEDLLFKSIKYKFKALSVWLMKHNMGISHIDKDTGDSILHMAVKNKDAPMIRCCLSLLSPEEISALNHEHLPASYYAITSLDMFTIKCFITFQVLFSECVDDLEYFPEQIDQETIGVFSFGEEDTQLVKSILPIRHNHPLQAIYEEDKLDLFKLVTKYDKPLLSNLDRNSPIHNAAKFGAYNILSHLLQSLPNNLIEAGRIVNASNANGDVALTFAVQSGNINCVSALINNNAMTEMPNDNKITPKMVCDQLLKELERTDLDESRKDFLNELHAYFYPPRERTTSKPESLPEFRERSSSQISSSPKTIVPPSKIEVGFNITGSTPPITPVARSSSITPSALTGSLTGTPSSYKVVKFGSVNIEDDHVKVDTTSPRLTNL